MKIKGLLVSLLLIALLSGSVLAADHYINGIDSDFPPYGYIDENGNPAGFDVESLNWIADEMGFTVSHQPTAWDGIIPALLAKKIDMVYSGMSITPAREEVVNFSIPYWIINQAVAVREDSDLNMTDLTGPKHKIGSQRGCTAAEWIEEYMVKTAKIPKNNFVQYETFSLAVNDLVNGRIDFAMMDDVMVEDAVRKGQPIRIIGVINTDEFYGIAVRKEDTKLKALLDEGIKRLQKSARWDELIEKYFSE